MDRSWTLNVENFGKIKKASITIAPFMCFVGDNNAGKSYLMSLLWGILSVGIDYFPKTPSDNKAYKACEHWLQEHLNVETQLTQEDEQLYVDWFSTLLQTNKKRLVNQIFNYNINIDSISISQYKSSKPITLKWGDESVRYSAARTHIQFPSIAAGECTREQSLRMNSYLCWNILMEGIAAPLYTPVVRGRRMGEPVYLPASRTGFMLTYPQLVSNSLLTTYAPETADNPTGLTLPYIDFLQLITEFEESPRLPERNKRIVDFMEERMTQGRLRVYRNFLPEIQYQPEGSDAGLPLYVSSSIITEMSPLLLLFKSNINFKVLVIEEPEAHLHPRLQMLMAQLLINISNAGIPVWMTTHSDAILQQVNNMIKLETNPQKEALMQEFGYNQHDLLDINHVEMYQFETLDDGRTILQQLDKTKYGVVVPTFNDVIHDTIKEVQAFQGEEDE